MDLVYRYFKKQGIEITDDNKLLLMEHASIISLDKESSEYCVTLGGLLIFSRTNNIYIPHNMIRIINRIQKGMDEISVVKGDLLSVLDESEEILKKILPKNYPIDAVNEGIKNAVVYRDYTMFHREIEIMINTSGISITSPGIIASGKDINPQSYYRRNMWLYEKLIYLDPKERFLKAGKGFTKIRKAFKNHGKVLFINSLEEDYFKIVYPPINIFNAPKVY